MPLVRIDKDLDRHPFTDEEKKGLRLLADKHEQYTYQCRGYEARSMARAYGLIFRTLRGDFYDTEPTQWDSL